MSSVESIVQNHITDRDDGSVGLSRFYPSMSYIKKWIAALHPAYFALVMATGIVSIDCWLLGLKTASLLLFWINVPAYFILWGLYLVRAVFFSTQFVNDGLSHKRGFGFFTSVAATSVLGSQFSLLAGNQAMAETLWWTALALWVLCTYSIFVLLAVKDKKPPLEEGINGGWLVSVVATQSICVLGCLVKPQIFGDADFSLLFLLSFWLFGGMLYIWLISLIFYRYMFFRFEPSDLIPPYWINMGAVAISTLAGAQLVLCFQDSKILGEFLPFVKGLTTMYWATATWWIPMLLVLGVWRHYVRRFKFTYDPLYWGLVFPLGMYSVCTFKLGQVLHVEPFAWVAKGFLVVALIAWLLTFLSMIKRPLYAVLLALSSARQSKLTVAVSSNPEGAKHGKS